MFAFVFTFLIIWLVMWGFFKFMYPKPPANFMPKAGDIIEPRDCDYCGYPLAEYRGVLEQKPIEAISASEQSEIDALTKKLAHASEMAPPAQALTFSQKKTYQKALDEAQKAQYTYKQTIKAKNTWFFCNYDHQASFHRAGNQPQAHQTLER